MRMGRLGRAVGFASGLCAGLGCLNAGADGIANAMPTAETQVGAIPYFASSTGQVMMGFGESLPLRLEPGTLTSCRKRTEELAGPWIFYYCGLEAFSVEIGAASACAGKMRFAFDELMVVMKPSSVDEFFFKGRMMQEGSDFGFPATMRLWYYHNDGSTFRGGISIKDLNASAILVGTPNAPQARPL